MSIKKLEGIVTKLINMAIDSYVKHLDSKVEKQNEMPDNVVIADVPNDNAAKFNLSVGVQLGYDSTTNRLIVHVHDLLFASDPTSQAARSFVDNANKDILKQAIAATALAVYKKLSEPQAGIDYVAKNVDATGDSGYIN